ncbi:hypothetical protein M1545_03410 [Patescibacteria group bacterium]|nr:hypothetical protein [Patescibacteria group bacterium]
MAEDEKKIDPRDLLGHERYDFRRTIPKDVYEGYKKLLIGEISEEEGRPQLVVARGINRTPETIEAKRHVPLKDFSKEERVRLDKLEKETVTLLIRDLIRPAVWSVSDNGNIVPYDTPRTTDRALEEIKLLREDLEEDFSRHSQRPNLRYEQVMGEISRVEEWLEGTAGELTSAPATMTPFFDGKNMLQFAVKAAGQDVKSDALAKLFDPVGKIRAESDPNTTVLESWKLGKEIERKQDAVFEIMRAVAATHRRKERNMGREIAEGNDYPVTEKQADFLEEVFGCEEKIEVLTDVGTVAETGTKLQNLKSRDKSAKLASVKAFDSTTEGINELRRTARNDEFIWVYGVKQPVNEATLESLKWLIGSGETIYLGEMVDQNRLGYVRGQVAILQEIPTEINNIFVTSQEPERTVPVKRMIALIAEMDAMRRLDEGENVNELLRELREKETSYKPTILDEHIVDMARITLLHFLEGADLGWGFEYS